MAAGDIDFSWDDLRVEISLPHDPFRIRMTPTSIGLCDQVLRSNVRLAAAQPGALERLNMSRILFEIAAGCVSFYIFLGVSLMIKYLRAVYRDRLPGAQRYLPGPLVKRSTARRRQGQPDHLQLERWKAQDFCHLLGRRELQSQHRSRP